MGQNVSSDWALSKEAFQLAQMLPGDGGFVCQCQNPQVSPLRFAMSRRAGRSSKRARMFLGRRRTVCIPSIVSNATSSSSLYESENVSHAFSFRTTEVSRKTSLSAWIRLEPFPRRNNIVLTRHFLSRGQKRQVRTFSMRLCLF